MEILRCRTRLAILWIIRSLIPVFIFILSLLEPGTIQDLMSGKFGGSEVTEGFKLVFGAVLWGPWIMAWAAMTLKLSINRWANILLGGIFVILFFYQVLMNINGGLTAGLMNYIFGCILHILITWYGWKLPKVETSST
jgi:hypothetical protein